MTTEEKLIELYEKAEIRLREIITQKALKGNSTVYHRSLLKQIRDELKRLKRNSAAEVENLVKENYEDALSELIGELKASGVPVEEISPEPIKPAELAMSGLNKTQIQIIAENANYDFNRAINLVGRRIEDSIREAAIEATAEKLTEGQTVRQMQKNLEKKLEAQNLTAVEYANGSKMPIKQYAEMVSRSTTAETQNTAKIVQGQEWGYDLVKMTSHNPTCAICSMYQGRVYAVTKEAANGKYKLKDGTALHFPYLYETAFAGGYKTIHPNCRHRINEYVFSAYTQDELRKQDKANNAPFEDLRSDQERKAYSEMVAEKRRALANRRQYEKIKAALPNDAPKSFAGFMRMKRSNSENYQNLMRDYRYVQRESKARYKDSEGLFLTFDARDPSKGRDVIKPHSIINDLMKSDVGKKSLSFIKENNIPVYLSYNSDEGDETLLGYFDHGIITIFADRTKTVKETACTIVHEVTHARINKPNSKTQELQCYKNEYIHRGIELTDEVIQSIIKHIDKKYDVLEWE